MGDGRRRETAARHRGALGERIRWLVSGHATPHDGELTASEALARLHAVLDRLPIAVSAKDREGRFRLANAAMAASYGMSPEELVGTLQRDTHLAADQVERIHAADLRVIDGQDRIDAPNYPFWLPDGRVRRMDVTKLRLFGAAFPEPMVLTIMQDVTEEVRGARRASREERFAALGHVVARVAHDLRTPLATISASTASLRRRVETGATADASVLERIERNIARCDAIIGDLLNLSSEGGLSLEAVDVDAWVAEVVDDYGIHYPIQLVQDFALPGIRVRMDRERMTRALQNVVSNACEAMLDSEQGMRGQRCDLRVSTRRDGSRVLLRVEDTGPGMSKEVLERIHTPMFSTKSYGVGLGLAIVHDALERHAGGVEIDSATGEGTRITLWLPVRED